ncbi:hypothetical protein [Spiroplasma citri]|uniref:hypothetical protein n=1 Tax=Spiroplasma citri TaxID=2133 RepID=UPI00148B29C7|nr:hypothetical protein [Spiroplasma citri]QJU61299.1 hypothetical protein HHA36_01930 [Spiroplasma citri]
MWVLEKFGRRVPDLKRYPFLSKSYLDPQQHLKQKHNINNQPKWDQAWEWYDEYKKGTIPFLEYRIQIREKELEDSKTDYENYKKMTKLKRWQKGWVNYYEDIKIEIVKLKRELESLKIKENQKQQQTQPNLTLENENLRLKKEILFVKDIKDFFDVGDEIEVEVLDFDSVRKHLKLSYKKCHPELLKNDDKEIQEIKAAFKSLNKKQNKTDNIENISKTNENE